MNHNVFEITEKMDAANELCALLRDTSAPIYVDARLEIAEILGEYIGMLSNLKVVGGPIV